MLKLDLREIREHARKLAEANAEAEPSISDAYWFPAEDEIRLIEIDRETATSDCVMPFYFGEDPEGEIPVPSGIAIIRPEEKDTLSPPEGWGTWDDAERIWSRSQE